MIAAWMLSLAAVGAVLLVAACAAEALCARMGWARRPVWAGVMVAMCVLPFLPRPTPVHPFIVIAPETSRLSPPAAPATRTTRPTTGPATATGTATGTVPDAGVRDASPVGNLMVRLRGTTHVARPAPPASLQFVPGRPDRDRNVVVVTPQSSLHRFDRVLLGGWATLSTLVTLLVALATARLARSRRRWRTVDAATRAVVAREAGRPVPVWRSHDVGPAAFGLRTLQVVVPHWIDALPAGQRALLLAHEASHVRARDPQLLAAALAMVALLPWHLPLLVAYRRLCRAVEHDCDARVLARHGDARGYGRLLVHTAEWLLAPGAAWGGPLAARWILAPVPAFAAPASELESRLRALVRRRGGWRARAGAVLAGGAATVALVAACAVPSPTPGVSFMLDGVAGLPSPVRDSLRLYDRLTSHPMRRRMDALRDSLVASAARESLRGLDTLAGVDSLQAWVLMDNDFRPVASQVAPGFRYARALDGARAFDGTSGRAPVTAATPAMARAVDSFSWARAFPLLDPQRIEMHGSRELRTPRGTLRVQWARLHRGDTTSLTISRANGATPPIPRWFRTVAAAVTDDTTVTREQFRKAIDRGLRENLEWRVPEALDSTGRGETFVWLVLGPTGDAIAHATGREALARRGPATPAPGRPLPRVTWTTPTSELTIDDLAWRARFPTLGLAPASFGWTSLAVGRRTVNVLWALSDVSLVTDARATARRRARVTTAGRTVAAAVPSGVVPSATRLPDTLDGAARGARFHALWKESMGAGGHDDRFATLLRAAIAEARPDVLRGRRTDADFVWLVFDSTARVIAADTGRAGLGTKAEGWREFLPTPRATDRTARDSLVMDRDAWRAKFGDRARRGPASAWQGLGLPNGYVNVLWTVASRDD